MNKSWVRFGLVWGIVMALIINIGFPLLDGTGISWKKVAVSVPVWLVFGLIFGYVSQKRKPKNSQGNE